MSVRIYLSGNPVHDYVLTAMHEQVPGSKLCDKYEVSDVAVVYGVYKPAIHSSYFRGSVIAMQQYHGKKVIVIDSGYVHRGDEKDSYYSVGLNDINGFGDHKNKDCPSDRWDALGVKLEPMKELDDRNINVLLCGQVPWDASLRRINYIEWLHQTIASCQKREDYNLSYRPHPKFQYEIPGVVISADKTIEQALRKNEVVMAYNSNSLVDGLIAGCRSFAFGPGSMIHKDVVDEGGDKRKQWANDLAYAQWRPDEMGEAFTRMVDE